VNIDKAKRLHDHHLHSDPNDKRPKAYLLRTALPHEQLD
jgi:hypothetical protein